MKLDNEKCLACKYGGCISKECVLCENTEVGIRYKTKDEYGLIEGRYITSESAKKCRSRIPVITLKSDDVYFNPIHGGVDYRCNCPKCNYEYEEHSYKGGDGEEEIICENCNKTFVVRWCII